MQETPLESSKVLCAFSLLYTTITGVIGYFLFVEQGSNNDAFIVFAACMVLGVLSFLYSFWLYCKAYSKHVRDERFMLMCEVSSEEEFV